MGTRRTRLGHSGSVSPHTVHKRHRRPAVLGLIVGAVFGATAVVALAAQVSGSITS